MRSILYAVMVIAGTYILSKQIFENSFKRQVNFKFRSLPLSLKIALIIFGDKRRFENGQLWESDYFPSPGNFTWMQKIKLLAPFIGFILICLGTLGALF